MTGRYLGCEELMKHLQPQDQLIPVRGGLKDYAPDESWLQNKKLEAYYKERKDILSVERVLRVGFLARGEWRPSVGRVEVIKDTGKFWHRVGYVEQGKKYLFPEEAMFAVDQAQLEVYYGEVPLTVQEMYSTVLCPEVPIHHYNVYSHLNRLGFIVRRHQKDCVQPQEELTEYEKRLNIQSLLPKRDGRRKRRKRKNSEDDVCSTKKSKSEPLINKELENEISGHKNMCENKHSGGNSDRICLKRKNEDDIDKLMLYKGNNNDDDNSCESISGGLNSDEALAENLSSEAGDSSQVRTWGCQVCNHLEEWTGTSDKNKPETGCLPHSSWDFANLEFPNISEKSVIEMRVAAEEFLPPGISVFKPEYTFNTAMLTAVGRRHKKQEMQLEFSHKSWISSYAKNCKNWAEYKKNFGRLSEAELLGKSPAACLWQGDVTPLVRPQDATSTAAVLDRLKVIEEVDLAGISHSKSEDETNLKIIYDVYQPDQNFRKTDPGQPYHRIAITRYEDKPLELWQMQELWNQSNDGVPVHVAVVDHGDISFYTISAVQLPTDITKG